MMRETETKIELTPHSFASLLACCTVLDDAEQLNVYYDCEDAISNRSGSLRIRFTCGAPPVITLKLPIERAGATRVSSEIEAPFPSRFPPVTLRGEVLPLPLHAAVAALCSGAPRRLGAMRNRRRTVRLPGGEIAELDRVTLPDGTIVHEIEVESEEAAVHDAALALIQRVAPDWRESALGKFQRFRAALREPRTAARSRR